MYFDRLENFKGSLSKPGRPSKDVAALREHATKAWSYLVDNGADISVLREPFWTVKKVCDLM